MLQQVADGVWVHESDFMQSNAVVVRGGAGVLLVDAGIRGDEIASIARDLCELGHPIAAGFSTHPHWDHLLWHPDLGTPPRYGTARCAAAVEARLSSPDWKASIAGMIPPDIIGHVPLDDLFGRITGLAAETRRIPWDGPGVRIIEHQAHAPGHAALLIEEVRVLASGDMLSDVLIPMLNLMAPDPIEDYLAALQLLANLVGDVDILIPGHGSIGRADQVRARIDQDRRYVEALRNTGGADDPRLDPSAIFGREMTGVHERQLQHVALRGERHGTPGR
jgi:glyoxylase-like metal-dependent hydrolase (beta-lactamase superfamily II)